MNLLLVVALLMVAGVGTAVVLTHDPARQAITLSAFGLALTLFFLVYQAPDVALSQLAVGTVVVPLMIALTVAKMARRRP
jgi:energy-converting hydrogenase B subunit D